MGSRETGNIGETVACQFLSQKGFNILERNYRKPYGEIDIIAEKDGVVRFIEVKAVTREPVLGRVGKMAEQYRPEEMAHESKLHKVARTAEAYMAEKRDKRDYQVDVVGIILETQSKKARCRLFEQVL